MAQVITQPGNETPFRVRRLGPVLLLKLPSKRPHYLHFDGSRFAREISRDDARKRISDSLHQVCGTLCPEHGDPRDTSVGGR